MEASLALQKALRGRLAGTTAVTSLVPATSIVDKNGMPATFPCILLGEGIVTGGGDIDRRRRDLYSDVHVWTAEPGLAQAKTIVGAIRSALSDGGWTVDDHAVADLWIADSRYLRDPDGQHAHAVLSIHALLIEYA